MKFKSLLSTLVIVCIILGILPYIVWKAPIDNEDIIYLDATLAQKVECFDENGQGALCTIKVNEFDTVFLLADWQIIDIDHLDSQQKGDYIKLGIEKDALELIDQSPSLILISAETESGSIATLESYHRSSNISKNIISYIGIGGAIVFSLTLVIVAIINKVKDK
jgi:hypothetical protein